TGKPYAGATWAGVKTVLDGYSRAWVAASVETAQATRRGEQTEPVLALRRVCLDRRLKEMKALTAVLSTADSKTVEKAIDAVHALPDLKRCSDTEALTTPVAPPGDERTRAAIDRIASSLAEAKALYDAGKFKQGLDVAQVAANEARALGYRPLQAEALYMLGRFQARTGATGAENTLAEAVWAAEAGRQDETKVLATSELVYFVGYQQGRFDDNQHWERLGTAALERLGPGHEALEAELLTSMGSVYLLAGRNAMAQGPLERALQLIGRQHPKRANVLTTLGALYGRQGKSQHARNVLEEAVSVIETSRGPEHPAAAYPHNNLADALMEDGEYEKALVHVQKALAIWASSLGPEHHIVGDGEDHLATILGAQGRHSESLQHYVRALEIKEKKLGAEHPDLAYSLDGIGQAYVGMGRPQEALPYLERALELRKHDAGGLADTRFNLARALWEAHQDRDRALSLATQAKQGFIASGNKKDADRVETWLAASRP
ncbi:MAG TPA: tetratricopeptide repeat protein, partial [Myxococcaceae bacterium]|nr:tetratricopeptide repeat protein [Myxococcaceae bacterium]